MRRRIGPNGRRGSVALVAAALALVLAACGSEEGTSGAAGEAAEAAADRPTIVVTTSVLGDLVEQVAGDEAEVEVVMPRGADPHGFEPSAQQAAAMREADLVVANGAGLEEGLLSAIDGARSDGAEVFEATSAVETIPFGAHGASDDHGHEGEAEADDHGQEGEAEADDHGHEGEAKADDHGHEGEAEADEHGEGADGHAHDAEAADPHFWQDVSRTAAVVAALGERIAVLDGVDAAAVEANVERTVAELEALDAEIAAMVEPLAPERRRLVTNHEAFGYFADRYGFEIVGTVIPSGTTLAEPGAAALAELATLVEETGVPAIFAENTQPARLAEALAAETGAEVEVVELFSDSLGDSESGGATYVEMMRTNATRIAEALA